MQQRQVNKPISVNLDKSKKYLTPTEAFYMLNRERNINGTGTLGKTTPLVANYLACLINQPSGDNYRVGSYFSELTNELYWWVFNTNSVHYIARLNGDGTCQIVYDGDCLSLSAAPEHAIEEWRCYLKYDRYCANQHGKQLVWTDGENEIGMIDVEASIATDSFTTDFFDICPDECAYIQMCVPEPCGALEGEFVTLPASEVDLTNHWVDIGIKVAFFHIYYDQRESTMSSWSTLYFQDSHGCFDADEGYPRCMKFTVPLGNPMVDKIEFVFSTDNGVTWRSSDIIEKYMPYTSSSQYWYQRELAALEDLDLDTCTFSYNFCNDKQCNLIDAVRASRVYNPMPRQPQGLIRIKNALGFYNYLEGNCPIDGSEAEKFEITADCNSPDNCVEEMVTVTAYAIVHNYETQHSYNGLVYREGGNIGDPDDETDYARFGLPFRISGNDWKIPDGMGQFFEDKEVRNFIAYVEGTNYWAQMEQYKADAFFLNSQKIGIVPGLSKDTVASYVTSQILNGKFYYQKYTLKVPKGTKGFIRLASQDASNGIPSEGQDTSTFVVGTIPNINAYHGRFNISSVVNQRARELYFDACLGDVELTEALIISDNYCRFETGQHSSSAYAGYVRDANNIPVEGAELWYDGVIKAYTDHNGFFNFYNWGDNNTQTISTQVRVETNCAAGFNTVKGVVMDGQYNNLFEINIQITDTDFPNYKSGYYETVTIPIKDCDNEPVGGIRVALTGTKYEVTDAVTGIATFHVRNYSNRARIVMALVMDINTCFTLDCSDSCNPCLPSTALTALPACFLYPPHTTNIATTTNLNKEPALAGKKGLKAGGRYGWAFVVKGGCGKISSAYPMTVISGSLPTGDNYMNIPKTQEKGALSFCSYDYDATGMVLPDWAECVAIARTTNLNNYELQWVIDDIERTADRKIRLTIQSLNDYNATYNFKTNTLYQYADNDRVEFVANGNGDVFDTATYGLLNYKILSPFHDKIISGETSDTEDTDFFNQILIDDDGNLDDLTVGAKIELQRPKSCTDKPEYREVAHLGVVNMSGQIMLANPTGTITTFDTFIVVRQIENSNPLESNPPQQFEHKFPSDFWGHQNTTGIYTGLDDTGKIHFSNPFENEKRVGRQITINSETKFNRFGDLVKTLDAPEQGDVIAMAIYDGKIGLGIGEFDSFLFQVSDEFLRVASNGLIIAAPPDSLVSDTQPKISGIFGCRYDSIGSINFNDGWVTWIDKAKGSFVKHDFNIAQDISKGKFNLWVKKTIQYMENFNSTAPNDVSKLKFCTGFNFHTGALQLTVKALNQGGGNNEQEPFINYRSTILVEPRTEELLTFASYTPEGYSNIVFNNSTGCAFVSFYLGVPYIHPIIPIEYNKFFGQAVDTFVGVSIHHETGDKEINPMAMEVQCETMWFATKITVDETSFESEIPAIRWTKKLNSWRAEFLCDKNSRGGLYGSDSQVAGKKPSGYFCAVTLCRDNTDQLKYNTIDNAKRVIFDELDLVISKASFNEQSGDTGNL